MQAIAQVPERWVFSFPHSISLDEVPAGRKWEKRLECCSGQRRPIKTVVAIKSQAFNKQRTGMEHPDWLDMVSLETGLPSRIHSTY